MKKLTLMCGLPGSGKSYWAKMHKNENEFIINRDKIRIMLNGKYIVGSKIEDRIQRIALRMAKEVLRSGHDVIIDELNISKRTRSFWISNLMDGIFCDKCEIICFNPADIEIHVHNRMLESMGYTEEKWREIIQSMNNRFDIPTPSEGFINTTFIDVYNYAGEK